MKSSLAVCHSIGQQVWKRQNTITRRGVRTLLQTEGGNAEPLRKQSVNGGAAGLFSGLLDPP